MAVLRYINQIAWLSLIPLGIILSSNPANYIIFAFFLIYWTVIFLDKRYSWNLSQCHLSFILVGIYLNMFGDNFFRFYFYFAHYDKFLHFMIPFGITYILMKTDVIKNPQIAFLLVMGASAMIELWEFYTDAYFGTLLQGVFVNQGTIYLDALTDTILDLTTALVASLMAQAWVMMISTIKARRLHLG